MRAAYFPGRVMAHSYDGLLAEALQATQNPLFRRVVQRHYGHSNNAACTGWPNTRIHPSDPMLRHSLKHHANVNQAVSQYFNVALQQHNAAQQILGLVFDQPHSEIDILDFACGYGRLLRFLNLHHPRTRIWAADIQQDAVSFVTREFGVQGLGSCIDPQRFDPARHFDFIWVASLFSHLPEHLFHGWLARLYSLLTPPGVLCFSVHNEALLPAHIELPADGIYFVPASEDAALDNKAYGTTFVSDSFVTSAITKTTGNTNHSCRIRRALAHEQDIYVISKQRHLDPSRLATFRYGPWGWVQQCQISSNGVLELDGWAASLDDGALDSVDITVNGTTYLCPTGIIREDVRRVFDDERLIASGWKFSLPVNPTSSPAFIDVTARSTAGESALLYAGHLPATAAAC